MISEFSDNDGLKKDIVKYIANFKNFDTKLCVNDDELVYILTQDTYENSGIVAVEIFSTYSKATKYLRRLAFTNVFKDQMNDSAIPSKEETLTAIQDVIKEYSIVASTNYKSFEVLYSRVLKIDPSAPKLQSVEDFNKYKYH
jgi:hypothetical protein